MSRFIFFFLSALIFLPGCATLTGLRDAAALKAGYISKNKADAAAEAARDHEVKAVNAKETEVQTAQEAKNKALEAQIQKAADGHFGIDQLSKTIAAPDRTDLLIANFNEEGWAALGHPMPSYDALIAINARIKVELDATKTTLSDLQASHAKAMADNLKLADQAEQASADLAAKKDELAQTIQIEGAKVDAAGKAATEADNKIVQLEHARADDAKAIQAFKEKISIRMGIAAALLLVLAVYSPVYKIQLGALSGLALLIAAGVWYITGTIILIGAIIAGLGVIIWFIYEHNKESKAALATYQALAEVKDKAKDVWDKDISPTLQAWQTKYVTAPDGTVTTVPDPSIAAHIDSKLMAVGDK